MKQQKQSTKRKKSFLKKKLTRYIGIAPLSKVVNILLGSVILLIFILINDPIRDFLTKKYVLPALQEFDLPHIEYDQLTIKNYNTLEAKDIRIFDDQNQKFLSMQTLSISPNNVININQGIEDITINNLVIYKKPVFDTIDKTQDTPVKIPDVPFDIETFTIDKLTLKSALTGLKHDINLRVFAQASTNNKIKIKVTSLDKDQSTIKFDMVHKDQVLSFKSLVTAPDYFVNQLIQTPYFKGIVQAEMTGKINIKDPNIIKIAFDRYDLKDQKLHINGKFTADIYPNKQAMRGINLALKSGENHLTYRGDISTQAVDGNISANNFDLIDIYPIDPDLKFFKINGDLSLKGNYKNIPKSQGNLKILAHYKNTPFDIDLNGEYADNVSRLNLVAKTNQKILVKGDIFSNIKKQTGKIQLLANPQYFPKFIRDQSDIITDTIKFKSSFAYTNHYLNIKDGFIHTDFIKPKYPIENNRIEMKKVNLSFDVTQDKINLKPSNWITFINQNPFKTQINAKTFGYYRPKSLNFRLENEASFIQAALNHKQKYDYFQIEVSDLNLKNILSHRLPIMVSDFDAQSQGRVQLFAKNPLKTLTGSLKAALSEDDVYLNLGGTIKRGNINADYALLLDDQQAGTGNVRVKNSGKNITSKGNIDLQALSVFLKNTEHRLAGILENQIIFKNNALSGDFSLKGGAYKNMRYHTELEDINLAGKLAKKYIDITEFSANSKPSGKIFGGGIISFDPKTQSNFKLETVNFSPLQSEMITVKTDTVLALKGSSQKLKLAGNILLKDLEIALPDLDRNYTPKLNIEHETSEDFKSSRNPQSFLDRITTDITLEIAKRSKIYGFGLKGFPEGTLEIIGQLSDPKVNGQINIARGNIVILGKNFEIDRGGIFLSNTQPVLNVQASHNIDDYTVTLSLKGPVENPAVVFSSEPAVPRDEIIALLIFGKSKDNLSPFQALKLANAIYQISRGKSGSRNRFDVIGKTERFLNIDNINVESDNTIGAGKYLHENIYVATEYNPITAQSDFLLELKLTDTVDLKAALSNSNNIDAVNNSEIMLRKVKDY